MLTDNLNRKIDYLRISVTDRCNLRCRYCVPAEGIAKLPPKEILSYEEILRVARVVTARGISKIRITGGEPLVRRDLVYLIKELHQLPGLKDLGLTTNGVLLKEFAPSLARAGLRRINVSLDSLLPDRYHWITGRDLYQQVQEGLLEAEKVGLSPIKLNVVALQGFNNDEILEFALLTKTKGYQVRFIEHMSFGDGYEPQFSTFSMFEAFGEINSYQKIHPVQRDGVAELYRFEDGIGVIGFISPISRCFCPSCRRIRLTADGKLRNCLFSDEEVDLKCILRGVGSDAEIEELLLKSISKKPPGHMLPATNINYHRRMPLIGG
ncbi:MAG: GTP 3',8-cyclase MoaA [Deltaproteobacteria bacterium]|nr:MAG: GTP 3',8-cyclase MoaA [Deltaproteobacteria bacterium]